MSFEAAVRSRLKTALSGITSEVHWDHRPQSSSFPAVVLQDWFGSRDKHMKGVTGTQRQMVQVDCFAESATQAIALRNAAIEALEPPATVGGVNFQSGIAEMRPSPPRNTSTGTIHRRIFDIELWFN